MKDEANSTGPGRDEQWREAFLVIQDRLGRLMVSVWVMTLVLILTVVAVFGNLVNYFSGDVLLWGGVTAGGALLGFVFGWIARRRG